MDVGEETVSQIFSRTMQGALDQQARNYERSLEPLVKQLCNLTENVNGLTIQMAVMIEQQKHAHTSPCSSFQEFRREQQEENKALHSRISQHKDDDHRNDKKERSSLANTFINLTMAVATIGAVAISIIALFH